MVLLKIMSIGSIALSFIILVFLIFGKMKTPKAGKKSKSGWIIRIVMFVALISVMVVLLWFNLHFFGRSEINVKDLFKGTITALASSSVKLLSVSFGRLAQKENELIHQFGQLPQIIVQNIAPSELSSIDQNFKFTDIGFAAKFADVLKRLSEATCFVKISADYENIPNRMKIMREMGIVEVMKNAIQELGNRLLRAGSDLTPINVKETKLSTVLMGIKDLVNKLSEDFNSLPSRLHDMTLKIKPTISTQSIVFWLINSTLGFLVILLALLLIDSFVVFHNHFNKTTWCVLIKSVLLITVVLTIGMSSVIALMSFNVVAKFDCPIESDNFGIANISTSVTHDICTNHSATLLSPLNIGSNSFNDLKTTARIDHLQKMAYGIINLNSSTNPVVYINSHGQELEKLNVSIQEIFKSIDAAINTSCLTDRDVNIIEEFRVGFSLFLSNSRQLKNALLTYKSNIENMMTQTAGDIDDWHSKGSVDLSKEFERLKLDINSVDLDCKPIISEIVNLGSDLCHEASIPLVEFQHFLIAIILLHIGCLLMLTSLHIGCNRKKLEPKPRSHANQLGKQSVSANVPNPDNVPSPLETLPSVLPDLTHPTLASDSPAPPSIRKSLSDAVTNAVTSVRMRLRRLREHVDRMRAQEASDANSDKFEKKGPVVLHLTGVGVIPVEQPEPDVVLDRVWYDPSGNEQYDIGSDVDVIAPGVGGGPKAKQKEKEKEKEEQEFEVDPTQKTEES